jgi:hypothetical protein
MSADDLKRSDINVEGVVIDPDQASEILLRVLSQYLDAVHDSQPVILVSSPDLACLLAMASLWAQAKPPT